MSIDSDGRVFCSEEHGHTFSVLLITIQQERHESDRTYVNLIDEPEENEKFVRGLAIAQRSLQMMHRGHHLVARYTHAETFQANLDLYRLVFSSYSSPSTKDKQRENSSISNDTAFFMFQFP